MFKQKKWPFLILLMLLVLPLFVFGGECENPEELCCSFDNPATNVVGEIPFQGNELGKYYIKWYNALLDNIKGYVNNPGNNEAIKVTISKAGFVIVVVDSWGFTPPAYTNYTLDCPIGNLTFHTKYKQVGVPFTIYETELSFKRDKDSNSFFVVHEKFIDSKTTSKECIKVDANGIGKKVPCFIPSHVFP